ncbi:hypothetical protein HZB78_05130 [Candidatus Collierbacteria bacterium]|nr:hypothetical protein [Candidatus Collierbacteria bacterium]
MVKEFTKLYDQNKQKICVGDLVVLTIPRKERRDLLVIFEVVKDDKIYKIIYSEKFSYNTMSVGSPQYSQRLNFQVYKVIGSIKTGIDENLLE